MDIQQADDWAMADSGGSAAAAGDLSEKGAGPESGSSPTPGLFDELKRRGLVQDFSNPDLGRILDETRIVLYCGFDPTADSLQLGNLIPLTALKRFQDAGHRPIVVMGGGTGMIGDPSGKSDERNLLDEDTIQKNLESQKEQFERVLDFDSGADGAILVNNLDWLTELNLIDFLRDVGKSFPVSVMMSRESVKQRMGSEGGISFTEFSYQILQAYDFYHLYSTYACRLQVGGSDQYGNILAGVDYIRRRTGSEHGASALTFPLVTTATGEKFGKTASGTLWLDARRTSPYEWYQYWLNVDDRDAARYLRYLTFLDLDEVDEIELRFDNDPSGRLAQNVLAQEMTAFVHGSEEAEKAAKSSKSLFTKGVAASGSHSDAVESGAPAIEVPAEVLESGYDLVEALLVSGLAGSKTGAKRLIRQGGVSINGIKIGSDKRSIDAADVTEEQSCLISVGPRRRAVIRFTL